MKIIYHFFTKWFCILCVVLLAGCSNYRQTAHSFPLESLKKTSPHYVSIQNGSIEYYRFGKGTPIVLIPGYATDVTSWNRKFLRLLAERHEVILPNNRYVGGSFVRSTAYNTKELANDTYQLIKNLKLNKPAVMGISMGGMIAQQLAVIHPESISQLILVNTAIAGQRAIHPKPGVEKRMLNLPKNKLGRYVAAVKLLFPPNWKVRMAYALAADRFQPQNYQEIEPGSIMLQQQQLVMQWIEDNDTAKKIARLDLPVLILNGEADIVIPPANSIILAKTIPRARLVRWKEGGHAMIYQYPEEVANTINNFL